MCDVLQFSCVIQLISVWPPQRLLVVKIKIFSFFFGLLKGEILPELKKNTGKVPRVLLELIGGRDFWLIDDSDFNAPSCSNNFVHPTFWYLNFFLLLFAGCLMNGWVNYANEWVLNEWVWWMNEWISSELEVEWGPLLAEILHQWFIVRTETY